MGLVESAIDSLRDTGSKCCGIEQLKKESSEISSSSEYSSSSTISTTTTTTSESSSDSTGVDTDTEAEDETEPEIEAKDDVEFLQPLQYQPMNHFSNIPSPKRLPSTGGIIPFHTSSSWSMSEPVPSDLLAIHKNEINESLIPTSSKIIINLSHLLANILKEYFKSNKNECQFNTIDVEDILTHIVIAGDSPRNYLLGIPMENNLDIIIDTRELTKMHLNHLKEYHHTIYQQTSDSQCILWKHYFNKFNSSCVQKDIFLMKRYNNNDDKIENAMKSFGYISECEYMLNAKFITWILMQSTEFENKLSVYHNTNHHKGNMYSIQIIDEIQCGEYNLDGINFNIFDHHEHFYKNITMKKEIEIQQFHQNTRRKLRKYHKQNKLNLFMRNTEIYNLLELDFKHSARVNDKNEKLIEFNIPKFKHKLSKCIENCHNSFNFFILPFSSIVDDDVFFDAAISPQKVKKMQVDYDWRHKILNGVNGYDSFNDLERQIITHPNPKKIIKIYKPYNYFWSLIKICIQCVEYEIDPKIIKITMDFYKSWVENEQFLMNNNNNNNNNNLYGYNELLNTLFHENICCSWLDFKTMLEIFEVFSFNDVLIKLLRKANHFKKRFIEEIHDQDDDVIDLFEDYNYPIN